jgi:alanyl-tRNA synthetase
MFLHFVRANYGEYPCVKLPFMTARRLYYDDAFQDSFSARVLSCEPLAEAEQGGFGPRWGIILDQTIFYPTSGGQPHDLGKLGDANVVDVVEKNEEIVHVVNRPLKLGLIDGCIDWPRRFDHMQQHTGQHLLSAIFQERFGLVTVSFHLGESSSTIDLRGPQPSAAVLQGAVRASNAVVFADREIIVRYGTAEEFAQQGVRKQVDRKGVLRAIEIVGIDLQPCGGTHLRHTGQLGLVLPRGCSKIRQDWRVEFVCGSRADSAAREDFQLLQDLSATLKCAPLELAGSVGRLQHEREVFAKRIKAMLPRIAEADASALLAVAPKREDGLRIVTEISDGAEPDYLQHLAGALTRSESVVALIADRKNGAVLFAQTPNSNRDISALLSRVFTQFPGKGGGSRDLVRGAFSNPADCVAGLQLAAQSV